MVDVESALTDGTLEGNCYFVDNNRYRGSTGEGTSKLVSMIEGNQILNWLVFPIDVFNATSYPYLANIKGEAVENGNLMPQVFESPDLESRGLWWGGSVLASKEGEYKYTLTINVAGQDMDVSAFFYYKRPFSNFEVVQIPVLSHLPDPKELKKHPINRPLES